MKVGVPREVKNHEYRVAITPAGVHELVRDGHEVFIEAGAGEGSSLPDEDFTAAGAAYDQTENLVNEPFRIGSVDSSMLLVEMPETTRVSLRSRELVDVAALAARFGGGGHARAAGLRSDLPLDELAAKLIEAFASVLS